MAIAVTNVLTDSTGVESSAVRTAAAINVVWDSSGIAIFGAP